MKTYQIVIGIIIALALLAFLFFDPFELFSKNNDNPRSETITVTQPSSDSLIHMYEDLAVLEAEKVFQEKLCLCEKNNLSLITEIAKLNSTIDSLRAENAKLKLNDKKLRIEIDALKKQLKNSVQTTTTSKNQEKVTTKTSSQSTDVNIAINSYVGDVVGDAGCSFDDDSRLFFYVKTSLLNSINGRDRSQSNLNGESGPAGEEYGIYTYYKTPILVLTDMLDQEWTWTAYVGNHSQGNFDMWLWHELVKLNTDLTNLKEINSNGLGGYDYTSKLNCHSK